MILSIPHERTCRESICFFPGRGVGDSKTRSYLYVQCSFPGEVDSPHRVMYGLNVAQDYVRSSWTDGSLVF